MKNIILFLFLINTKTTDKIEEQNIPKTSYLKTFKKQRFYLISLLIYSAITFNFQESLVKYLILMPFFSIIYNISIRKRNPKPVITKLIASAVFCYTINELRKKIIENILNSCEKINSSIEEYPKYFSLALKNIHKKKFSNFNQTYFIKEINIFSGFSMFVNILITFLSVKKDWYDDEADLKNYDELI